MANFFSRLFGKKQSESKSLSKTNAKAISNLLSAAQNGIEALSAASMKEQIECDSCGNKFIAALGMQSGGKSTIVCPQCKTVIYTR